MKEVPYELSKAYLEIMQRELWGEQYLFAYTEPLRPPLLELTHLLKTGGFVGSNSRIIREIDELVDIAARHLKQLGVHENMVFNRPMFFFGVDWGVKPAEFMTWSEVMSGNRFGEFTYASTRRPQGAHANVLIPDEYPGVVKRLPIAKYIKVNTEPDFTKHENKDPKK